MNDNSENEWVTGNVTLTIQGRPIEMEMTVPAKPVKPQRMLPILQKMTSGFIGLAVGEVESAGEEISCKAGCGACCRQPVPLAEVEAYQIAELVENMPEPRRSEIKKKFAEACSYLHEKGWFERMEKFPELSIEQRMEIVMEYFYEGIPCPFLEDESCSIHPVRPLSCREYLVTSPAENCSKPTVGTIRQVEMRIKPSQSLRRITVSENLDALNFVPMIRALEWAEMHPESFPEKTGEQWMADFFRDLTQS
jgi:Uncharacterised protein family (UPF0153).